MVRERVDGSIADAVRQPGLLVLCGLIGVLELVTWLLAVGMFAHSRIPVVLTWIVIQRLALVAILALFLPACYATVREGLDPTAAIDAVPARVASEGRRLLASMLVSRLVVFALTVGFLLSLLTVLGLVDTALVWVASGVDRTPLALSALLVAPVVASWFARGSVALHDVRALDGGEPAWRAPLWSLRAWRGRGGGLLRYSLVRGLLLAAPPVVGVLTVFVVQMARGSMGEAASIGELALAALAFVLATAVARAALIGYTFHTYERMDVDRTTPLVPRSKRVVVAGLVVVATLAGVAAVRTVDVHPSPSDEVPGITPTNSVATIETAVERTRARERTIAVVTEFRNETAGRWQSTIALTLQRDRSDRQFHLDYSVGARGNRINRTLYGTDGRLAFRDPPRRLAAERVYHYAVRQGRWGVLVGPPYGYFIVEQTPPPPADLGWRLDRATDEHLVYRIDDPSAFVGGTPGPFQHVPDDEDCTVRNGTNATLVVDRDTQTVARATQHVDYVVDRPDGPDRVRKRVRYRVRDIGNVDVERPDSLPAPGGPALFWDAVYY